MHALLALWLPILLSAVTVFILSSLIHMLINWHASDYRGLANEDEVRTAVRASKPSPGQYVMPYCGNMKEMGSDSMKQKYREGPVGFITITPSGDCAIGKFLLQWFILNLVVAGIAACLATHFVALDVAYARQAAKLVGAVTFIAYGIGTISDSIWMGRPWSTTAKFLGDAALYAIGSAAIFWWLWK